MRKTGFLLLLVLAVTACTGEKRTPEKQPSSVSDGKVATSITTIVSSEELILALTPELRHLNKSLANLQVPDQVSRNLFSDTVIVASRLADPMPATKVMEGISKQTWDLAKGSESVARDDLELWKPLFSNVKYIRHGKFYFVSGSFADGSRTEYQANMGSAGSAVLDDDRILGWTAKIEATWSRAPEEDRWTISKWKTKSLETTVARTQLFEDVLDGFIDDDTIYSLATTSLQDQKTSDLYQGTQPNRLKGDKYPFFPSEVTLEHPAVAVVDIDSDGHDDVFVLASALRPDPGSCRSASLADVRDARRSRRSRAVHRIAPLVLRVGSGLPPARSHIECPSGSRLLWHAHRHRVCLLRRPC